MMLWMTHFFPDENWAVTHRRRSLRVLDRMWQSEGYFSREPHYPKMKFAFTNYGVSVGLQSVGAMPDRVDDLNRYFETYSSGDEYDTAAITHVMACTFALPRAADFDRALNSIDVVSFVTPLRYAQNVAVAAAAFKGRAITCPDAHAGTGTEELGQFGQLCLSRVGEDRHGRTQRNPQHQGWCFGSHAAATPSVGRAN